MKRNRFSKQEDVPDEKEKRELHRLQNNARYERYRPVDGYVVRRGEASVRKLFYDLPQDPQTFDVSKLVLTPGTKKGFEPDKLIVLLGKRRTGKSFTLDYIFGSYCPEIGYDFYEVFPAGLVITSTKLNNFWNQRFPDEFIHESLDVIDVFFEVQRAFVRQWNATEEWQDPSSDKYVNPYRALVVDDMAAEEGFKHDHGLTQIAVRGRHSKAFVAITTQYIVLLNTTLRENLDMLFMMYLQGVNSYERIAESYFADYYKLDVQAYIQKHTSLIDDEQRQVLVYDNSLLTHDLTLKLSKILPEKVEDYLLGGKAFWASEPERYTEFSKKRDRRRARSRKKFLKSDLSKRVKPLKISEKGMRNAGTADPSTSAPVGAADFASTGMPNGYFMTNDELSKAIEASENAPEDWWKAFPADEDTE